MLETLLARGIPLDALHGLLEIRHWPRNMKGGGYSVAVWKHRYWLFAGPRDTHGLYVTREEAELLKKEQANANDA